MKQVPQKVFIPGFDNKYFVTPEARVYNARTGHELKPVIKPAGSQERLCARVVLYKGDKRKHKTLSWVMRMCFFGGREGVLMHLDGSALNYNLWNLKLCSVSDVARRTNSYRGKAVVHRHADGTEDIYTSAAEAGKALFVSAGAVRDWCLGRHKNRIVDGEFRYEESEKFYNSKRMGGG